MTVREFNLKAKGYNTKCEQDQYLLAWVVVHIVNRLGTLKEPVGIDDLLPKKKTEETSTESLKEAHNRIKQRFGAMQWVS